MTVQPEPRIVYCHCAFAQVVPADVKEHVLQALTGSGKPFEAVADLCEMSARRDPALRGIADGRPVVIAACYPRAVRWLFSAAEAPLPAERVQVLNMRTRTGDDVARALLGTEDV